MTIAPVVSIELLNFIYRIDPFYREQHDHFQSLGSLQSLEATVRTNESQVKNNTASSFFNKFVSCFCNTSETLEWIGRQICKIWNRFKTEWEYQNTLFQALTESKYKLGLKQYFEHLIKDPAVKRWQPIVDLFGSVKALQEHTVVCKDAISVDLIKEGNFSKAFRAYPKGCILIGTLTSQVQFLAFRVLVEESKADARVNVQCLILGRGELSWKHLPSTPKLAFHHDQLTDYEGSVQPAAFTALKKVCQIIVDHQVATKGEAAAVPLKSLLLK